MVENEPGRHLLTTPLTTTMLDATDGKPEPRLAGRPWLQERC